MTSPSIATITKTNVHTNVSRFPGLDRDLTKNQYKVEYFYDIMKFRIS